MLSGRSVGTLANMPTPGKKWRHVVINTRSSWLPGDERGFHNCGHRAHSSRDNGRPPPPGEHKGLFIYNTRNAREEIYLPRKLRPIIGDAILSHFEGCEHRILAIAVMSSHVHVLVELPDNILRVRAIVGEAKRISSRAVKAVLRGSIWSAGGTYKPVVSRDHHCSVYNYILYDQGSSAWTWSYKDGAADGRYNRTHPQQATPHTGA